MTFSSLKATRALRGEEDSSLAFPVVPGVDGRVPEVPWVYAVPVVPGVYGKAPEVPAVDGVAPLVPAVYGPEVPAAFGLVPAAAVVYGYDVVVYPAGFVVL